MDTIVKGTSRGGKSLMGRVCQRSRLAKVLNPGFIHNELGSKIVKGEMTSKVSSSVKKPHTDHSIHQ